MAKAVAASAVGAVASKGRRRFLDVSPEERRDAERTGEVVYRKLPDYFAVSLKQGTARDASALESSLEHSGTHSRHVVSIPSLGAVPR